VVRQNGLVLSVVDRWIIGALLFSLCAVLWWIMVDIRVGAHDTEQTVQRNSNRLTDLERRMTSLETTHVELRAELRDHRFRTEADSKADASAFRRGRNKEE